MHASERGVVPPGLDPDRDYSRSVAEQAYAERTGYRPQRGPRSVDVPYYTAPAGHCRWCGYRVEEPRRTRWHAACVDAYLALSSQAGFRAAVEARDGRVCAECPPGTLPMRRRPQQRGEVYCLPDGVIPERYGHGRTADGTAPHMPYRIGWPRSEAPACLLADCGGPELHVEARPLAHGPLDDRTWAADHIVPLWAGGAHSLDNAQTLCGYHHAAKTRREAAERALRRRLGGHAPASPGQQLALQ